MTFRLSLVAALLALAAESALAAPEPLSDKDISDAFGIPSNSIVHSDKTSEAVARHGDSIQSASLFAFPAEPHVSMQVLVSRGNEILSKPILAKLQSGQSQMTKVELDQSVEAYVGTEGFGPGGEGHVAVAHIPHLDLDFRIRLIFSSEGLGPVDSTLPGISTVARNKEVLYKGMTKLATSLNRSLASKTAVSLKDDVRPGAERTDARNGFNLESRPDTSREKDGANEIGGLTALIVVLIASSLFGFIIALRKSRSQKRNSL